MRISDGSSDVCSSDLGVKDRFQDAFRVAEHVVVPEPQDLVAGRFQRAGSSFIATDIQRMLAAVDLDHQAVLVRDEVDREAENRLLPSELGAELPAAQAGPEQRLGIARKSVVEGKSVLVRVNPGGRRIL